MSRHKHNRYVTSGLVQEVQRIEKQVEAERYEYPLAWNKLVRRRNKMRKRKARDIKAEHAGVKQQNIVDVEMVNRALAQAEQVARAEKLAQANKSEAHETIMQKTVAQASQVEKQERKVRWVWQHPLLPFGIMQITVKEVATWYYVQKVASIVYQVTGMNLNRTITYTVMTGDQPSCGCPSFQHRTGQQTCQHVDALRVLEQQDQK